MRVTSFTIFNNLTSSLRKDLESYATINQQLASGKRIAKPSDDIIGTARLIDLRMTLNSNEQYRRNMDGATTQLKIATTSLTTFVDTLGKVRSLLNTGIAGLGDPVQRQASALEAGHLRQMMADLANTKLGDAYLFSGFRTDLQPYPSSASYAYQGDNGVMNVPVNSASTTALNVPGSAAFSYSLGAPLVVQLSSGEIVHYTPGAGTAIDVEIRDATDTNVLDTYSFSNAIQMTDILANAIAAGDKLRLQSLADPFQRTQDNLQIVMSDIGGRLDGMNAQSSWMQTDSNSIRNSISGIEDADPVETAAKLKKMEVTLAALHESAARVLSQSLLDFLK